MYRMIRTFNSVGQGSFYTEEFYNEDRDCFFTMVYDCGSYGDESKIIDEIDSSGLKKDIDLLCISHFHADHINGLKYLFENHTIKKILLPFLHEEEKIEVYLTNISSGASEFIKKFSLSPQDTLQEYDMNSNTQIITININQDNENNEPLHIDNLRDSISSGQPIQIDNNSNWIYVPFNFDFNTRSKQLEAALVTKGINIHDFKNIFKIRQNEIINIYKSLKGDLKTNSLTIFSGHKDKYRCHLESFKPKFYQHYHMRECGCIYMGDYNTKGAHKWTKFENAFKQYFECVGTIQIPHHGSRHNYNLKLNFKPRLFSIMSAGIHNQYRHPHGSTLKQIILQDGIPIIVTENPHSKFIQKIDIF